eukprot:TRINITY_DN24551_c0_g1_i2.p1 TRINITY_DN24551_c0_g1~~TRINITY_DN24551_c0_g1_i2.p1  ORF type:complete len:284 (-),score=50.78 TRINITY_DN24551_c0_g1_i2:137-988(-)
MAQQEDEEFESYQINPKDMIWDDSALIDAYDHAVNQYKAMHMPGASAASGSRPKPPGSHKGNRAKSSSKGQPTSKKPSARSSGAPDGDANPLLGDWTAVAPESTGLNVAGTAFGAHPGQQCAQSQDDAVVFYENGSVIGAMKPGDGLPAHIFGQQQQRQHSNPPARTVSSHQGWPSPAPPHWQHPPEQQHPEYQYQEHQHQPDHFPGSGPTNQSYPHPNYMHPGQQPPPAPMLGMLPEDEDLSNLLLSWYYSGYYTGVYVGQQRARTSSQQSASVPSNYYGHH